MLFIGIDLPLYFITRTRTRTMFRGRRTRTKYHWISRWRRQRWRVTDFLLRLVNGPYFQAGVLFNAPRHIGARSRRDELRTGTLLRPVNHLRWRIDQCWAVRIFLVVYNSQDTVLTSSSFSSSSYPTSADRRKDASSLRNLVLSRKASRRKSSPSCSRRYLPNPCNWKTFHLSRTLQTSRTFQKSPRRDAAF